MLRPIGQSLANLAEAMALAIISLAPGKAPSE
jgi:hypothetical protein